VGSEPVSGEGQYQEGLAAQASGLKRLRAERGNKPYSAIEKRAAELFGLEASLPRSTQSAAFNGKFVGLDKLMWLVRTLMSWDEYGNVCQPPDYRDDCLGVWRARWTDVATLRSSPSKSSGSLSEGTQGGQIGQRPPDAQSTSKPPSFRSETNQPYPGGTRWQFNYLKTGFEFIEELVLYAEPDGSTITDEYIPSDINAQALWKMWVMQCADSAHKRWPELYRPGEVHISWYITRPDVLGVFEGAPHARDWLSFPGMLSDFGPDATRREDFLTHYTEPVHAETGETLNWLRLPVLDRGWNSRRADKGGFVQEATGWKPSPLQSTVDVRILGAAAGLYVPPPGEM
jgi:hypothetical protein